MLSSIFNPSFYKPDMIDSSSSSNAFMDKLAVYMIEIKTVFSTYIQKFRYQVKSKRKGKTREKAKK